jgi:hypothetical protein
MGLEHEVEFPDTCEIGLATAGAGNFLLLDKGHHIVIRHRLYRHAGNLVLHAPLFNELIGTVAHFTAPAVDERVVKLVTWPEATQACGFMRMAASRPTL